MEKGVGGSLEVDEAGVLGESVERIQVGQVAILEFQTELGGNLAEKPVRTPIEIVSGDHPVARLENQGQGVDGGHARAEGESGTTPFQLRQGIFQGEAGGILGPGIFKPVSGSSRAVLDIGAGEVDRWHHRTG